MASLIERPTFYEGQILAGADLDAGVDHARGQLARHERYLHLWGIAEGLALRGTDLKTAGGVAYQEVTLSAGVAIDASGREIVVAADTRLPDEQFEQSNVAVGQLPGDTLWYPVFLTGRDQSPPAAPLSVSQCGSSEANRVREAFAFDFDRPGTAGAEQEAVAVADGPDGGSATPRRVLLGFVSWDPTIARFTGIEAARDGVGPRYAGVRADAVAARGGALMLRTTSESTEGKPALAMTEDGNGWLAWGPLDGTGHVQPVFSVTAKGDLAIKGKFTGAVTPGSVQVQSGVATDGAILPLPPGITQEMLDAGKATAHVHATPRVPASAPPDATGGWTPCPLECTVDADRRVRCTVRWVNLTATPYHTDRPGACDYVVFVSVAAA